jgi:hypothetical protein
MKRCWVNSSGVRKNKRAVLFFRLAMRSTQVVLAAASRSKKMEVGMKAVGALASLVLVAAVCGCSSVTVGD